MKIGYPCINRSIGCKASSTFRLASCSEERIKSAAVNNLECLSRILEFNADKGLLFFRISSDIVPFASHPVCTFKWKSYFRKRFRQVGRLIKGHGFRISMHPDQFIVLNSPDEDVVKRSMAELEYHADLMELLGLDAKAKIQLHVGGAYGDKESAVERFIQNHSILKPKVRSRLVIENDERLYSAKDCLEISERAGIPVLFDSFHHSLLNKGESISDALRYASKTWRRKDGILMVDYSSQKKGSRPGTHAESLDKRDFRNFLDSSNGIDFDLMLEIKDKEKSALNALDILVYRSMI